MIFGLPGRFAVESTIQSRSSGHRFGHLRLWIGGLPVGDFNQNLILETPALFTRDFLALSSARNHSTLTGKTKEEVLAIIHWAHYSDGANSAEEQAHLQYRQFADVYSGCELCPALSASFDGEQAVLLEEQGKDRIIWKPFRRRSVQSVQEVVLHKGECLSVLRSFTDWIGSTNGGL